MSRQRAFLLTYAVLGLSAAAGEAPAVAGDLGPAFNWNGLYVGANVGGAWASNTVVQSNHVGPFSSETIDASGVVGGGHLGYNWMGASGLLVGIEADISAADLSGTATHNERAQFNERVDAYGTVRGRFGLVASNWLFYGTGGFAWGNDSFTRTQISEVLGSTPPLGDVRTNSSTRTGWVAGGGIEYGFATNWTARVEYLHLELGDESFSFTASNSIFRLVDQGSLGIDTVRVGVSYQLH